MAKILVIEDQLAVRGLLVDILVSDGHEVLAAADGRTGLELYARHRPFSVNQVLTAVRQLLGDGPPA